MNTLVKRAKSTALGKKCNPTTALLNTEKDLFHLKGAIGFRKGHYKYDITIYIWLLTLKEDLNTVMGISSSGNGCINMTNKKYSQSSNCIWIAKPNEAQLIFGHVRLLGFRYHSVRWCFLLGVLFENILFWLTIYCLFCFCFFFFFFFFFVVVFLFSNMYPKNKFIAKKWSDLCSFYSKVKYFVLFFAHFE